MSEEAYTKGDGDTEERQSGLGAQATFNPVLDRLRSETGRGIMTGAASGATVFTVPTGKAFHLTNYTIWKTTAAGRVQISASGAGATRRTLVYFSLAVSTFLAEQKLAGILVVASTNARRQIRASSILGNAWVRVGGVLRDRVVGDTTTP